MENHLKNKNILKIAKKVLSKYKICNNCLGRIYAKIENGLTNEEKGKLLRKILRENDKIKLDDCWLCKGLIGEIQHFVDLILKSLEDYDFKTFLVGIRTGDNVIDREYELLDFTGSKYAESIKTEMKREIGKILEYKLSKDVDFEDPNIIAAIDTSFDVVNIQIKPLFIYGRYKKFKRNIPQTRWFCRICRGKGCRRCNYTGKMYDTSVEELIGKRILELTGGTKEILHGCGREDIDARMLGNGRPFVLEIKNPKIRTMDLSKLEDEINSGCNGMIKVSKLHFSDRDEIVRIKSADFRKIYRILVTGEKTIDLEKLKKAAEALHGKSVSQFTPSRVTRRKSNMVRERKIYDCEIESVDGTRAVLTLEAESGTYIKELVSGDGGRTNPSISEMVGTPCIVKELDVIEIKGE